MANFSIIGNARKAWTCFSRCSTRSWPMRLVTRSTCFSEIFRRARLSKSSRPAANEVFWTPA